MVSRYVKIVLKNKSNRPLTEFPLSGLITRSEAEKLLLDQPYGSYLVRLSEKIWGYAISYRAKEKCKHYLVNSGQKYTFPGNNQIEHTTLGEWVTEKEANHNGNTFEEAFYETFAFTKIFRR